jgi:hypothetical protein
MLQRSLIIASFAVHPHNLEMKSYKYKLHKFKILLGPDLGNPASLSRNPILTPPHGVTSRQLKILEIFMRRKIKRSEPRSVSETAVHPISHPNCVIDQCSCTNRSHCGFDLKVTMLQRVCLHSFRIRNYRVRTR